jgi:hypothetical protein
MDALAADLSDYHLLHSARADMLRRLGMTEQARRSYTRALELATNASERRFLEAGLASWRTRALPSNERTRVETGIILFAHGSTVGSANDAVFDVARHLAADGGYRHVEVAFLDCAPPTLADAASALVADGIERIVVIPYFLTLGIHLQRDLPRIIEEFTGIHKHVSVEVTPPLDGHPALVEILLDRARSAACEEENRAVRQAD